MNCEVIVLRWLGETCYSVAVLLPAHALRSTICGSKSIMSCGTGHTLLALARLCVLHRCHLRVVQVDLGRSLRLWLDLQAAVNGLLDSSTAPESGAQVCLRPGACKDTSWCNI